MIDPMLFPGIMSAQDKIIEETMSYLNIDNLLDQKSHTAACVRLCYLLIQDLMDKPESKSKTARRFGYGRSYGHATDKVHRPIYTEEEGIHNFIYLNVKNKILGKKYYTILELLSACILKYPENNDIFFYKVKPFVAFLVKENMSVREINTLLGTTQQDISASLELKDKDLYLSIIKETMNEMIFNLKLNRL